jgi:uncharacterized NAD(P)/FAD-binding protein YdhS
VKKAKKCTKRAADTSDGLPRQPFAEIRHEVVCVDQTNRTDRPTPWPKVHQKERGDIQVAVERARRNAAMATPMIEIFTKQLRTWRIATYRRLPRRNTVTQCIQGKCPGAYGTAR